MTTFGPSGVESRHAGRRPRKRLHLVVPVFRGRGNTRAATETGNSGDSVPPGSFTFPHQPPLFLGWTVGERLVGGFNSTTEHMKTLIAMMAVLALCGCREDLTKFNDEDMSNARLGAYQSGIKEGLRQASVMADHPIESVLVTGLNSMTNVQFGISILGKDWNAKIGRPQHVRPGELSNALYQFSNSNDTIRVSRNPDSN